MVLSHHHHCTRYLDGTARSAHSKADKGSKVLFDTQTSCLNPKYPMKLGVVRTNQVKTTTYEQRGDDVYSIEFMYTNVGGWLPDWLVMKGMGYEMPKIVKTLTKKYSGFPRK